MENRCIFSNPGVGLLVTEGYFASKGDHLQQTQPVNFFDLCENYALQAKLQLATSLCLQPHSRQKREPSQLQTWVAGYLADFSGDSKEVYNFLLTNPVLTIYWY